MERAIPISLDSFQAQGHARVGDVAIQELVAEAIRPLLVVEGKGKAIVTEEQATQSLLALYTPKRRSTTDQFIFQRRTPATEEASTELGEDVEKQVDLKEYTDELDQDQAGSDPGWTRPWNKTFYLEDSNSVHLLKIKQRPEWLKPIPDDERPATLKPAWVIPTSHIPDAENNWANALASTYQALAEIYLLEKTGDMRTFMNWYCQKVGKTELTQADFEGQAYEFVKAFYPDVVHLQFQMEECYKMLTNQIDWAYPEGNQVRIDISRPLPLSGPPAYSHYRYDYLKEITLRRADYQEYTIAKKDFKNLYPTDFEDLNLLLLEGHLNHLSGSNKRMLSTAVNLWTRNLMIRQQVEDLQLGIESYQK
ncbi:hypothetical protein Tco_0437963 [Tanacetum coccineum]